MEKILISANEARKRLDLKLNNDLFFIEYIEKLNKKILEAIEKEQSFIRFKKTGIIEYNDAALNLLQALGYSVKTDYLFETSDEYFIINF